MAGLRSRPSGAIGKAEDGKSSRLLPAKNLPLQSSAGVPIPLLWASYVQSFRTRPSEASAHGTQAPQRLLARPDPAQGPSKDRPHFRDAARRRAIRGANARRAR
ncbi:hypothetical protein SBBP2_2190004 [Burkholderiales bacterium]|nr:hypothetical protein SBBP2_2190004 [Burkholderiales bacterium]